MATAEYKQVDTDGWTEIAADGTDYLLENRSRADILVTQQAAAPTGGEAYHILKGGESMVRIGTGAAYIKAPTSDQIHAIVTT